jgi:hypothetical protein
MPFCPSRPVPMDRKCWNGRANRSAKKEALTYRQAKWFFAASLSHFLLLLSRHPGTARCKLVKKYSGRRQRTVARRSSMARRLSNELGFLSGRGLFSRSLLLPLALDGFQFHCLCGVDKTNTVASTIKNERPAMVVRLRQSSNRPQMPSFILDVARRMELWAILRSEIQNRNGELLPQLLFRSCPQKKTAPCLWSLRPTIAH